jgi:ribonuclease H / adenosylcobalamin/alpha-ribazole phosphatase
VNATTIFVVRHGRTALNAQGKFRGHLDPPLDDEGLRQAQAAARRLQVSPPIHVSSSPLRRAWETAEAIARLSGAPVSEDEDLIDLDYGAWAGLSADEVALRDPEMFALYRQDPEHAVPPGGEPLSAVGDRVLKALQRLAETFVGQTVAAVSHEIPIRLAVGRVADLRGSDVWDLLLPTASMVRFTVFDGRFEMPFPRPVLVSRRWRDVPAPPRSREPRR